MAWYGDFGSVEAVDGRKYYFAIEDWLYPDIPPAPGLTVTFQPAGSSARQVNVMV